MNVESGTISSWNQEKNFGFIAPKSGGKPIFVHISDYSRKHKSTLKGLEVQYFVSTDQKGRRCAVEVCPLKGHKRSSPAFRQKTLSIFLLSSFAGILYFLFRYRTIPLELVGLYAVMSVIAFIMYAKDKSAAEWGTWRTSESTLHTLSLLGGWPGAALAQSFLRHKSKKISFRLTYWITVIANCGCLYWLVTPEGSLWLRNIIGKFHNLVDYALQ